MTWFLLLACSTQEHPVLGFPDPALELFREMDADGSKFLEDGEFAGGRRGLLADKDEDGKLNLREFRDHMATATNGSGTEWIDGRWRQLEGGGEGKGKHPPGACVAGRCVVHGDRPCSVCTPPELDELVEPPLRPTPGRRPPGKAHRIPRSEPP